MARLLRNVKPARAADHGYWRSALRHRVATFFEGSVESAVAALIESQSARLGAEDFERIAGIVEQAKKERATVAGGKPWLPWLWWLGCAAVCGRFLAGAARKATLQARGPRHAICSSARR